MDRTNTLAYFAGSWAMKKKKFSNFLFRLKVLEKENKLLKASTIDKEKMTELVYILHNVFVINKLECFAKNVSFLG